MDNGTIQETSVATKRDKTMQQNLIQSSKKSTFNIFQLS